MNENDGTQANLKKAAHLLYIEIILEMINCLWHHFRPGLFKLYNLWKIMDNQVKIKTD